MILDRFIHVQIYNEAGTSVQYDNKTDTGWGITTGTMKLDKILMNKELSFGELNSAKFECQIFGLDIDLSDRKIKVEAIETEAGTEYLVTEDEDYIVTEDEDYIVYSDDGVETIIPLFAGWIESSTNDYFSTDRNIIAYDWIYFHRKDNIADFWNTFWTNNETSTVATFRTALMTSLGLSFTTAPVSAVNDSLTIKNTFANDVTSLPLDVVLTSVMQLQCWALYMADFDKIQLVTISTTSAFDVRNNTEKLSSAWENYVTEQITGVGVYDSGSSLAQHYGTTDNMLKIVNNIFLLDMTAEEIETACQPILDAVDDAGLSYQPTTIKCIVSDFTYQLGNRIQTEQGYTYIMSMNLSGSLLIEQTLKGTAEGPLLSDDIDEFNQELINGNKYAKLIKNIDEFELDYGNYKEQVSTQFRITNSAITLKVDSAGNIGTCELGADPDDGLTYFRLNTDHIQFVANKSLNITSADLSIVSTNGHLNIDSNGNITATNVNLTGAINATSGSIGGFDIVNNTLTSYNNDNPIVKLDPTSGLTVYTLTPTMSSVALSLTAGAVSLLPYVNLYVEYDSDLGALHHYNGVLELKNELSGGVQDVLTATPDDIYMTHTDALGDSGWGGSTYYSLDSAMGKLLTYERIQADTEYTRTSMYCFGYITTNSTELKLFVPMKFAYDIPNHTSVDITAITGRIRSADGTYVEDNNLLPYFTKGYVSQVQDGLRLEFEYSGGFGGGNNTPVAGLITLTFAVRNYRWYYNPSKTLVVREKIDDGSFQWYINEFQGDASSNYGGYMDVPSNLAKFIKFPQAPPITIGRESIPALLLIVTNTRTGVNTNSFYFEHSTNAGNFYKRIRWTRGTDIHKAIVYDTEFLQTNYEISGSGAARNAHVYASGDDWSEPTFNGMTG